MAGIKMRLSRCEPDALPTTKRVKGQNRRTNLPEPLPLPAMNAACRQVFSAVELLEDILLHLDIIHLLRVQRVSRHWRAVVKTSPNLQRKQFLGFVPRSGDLSRFINNNHCEATAVAATTIPVFTKDMSAGGLHESPSTASLGVLPEVSGEEQVLVQFNPVFPCDGQTIRMRTCQFRTKADAKESWLDMYLTQLPCSDVHVGLYYIRKPEWRSRFGLVRRSDEPVVMCVPVRRETGVRARDVLEALSKACSEDSCLWQRIDIRVPWLSTV